MMKRIFAVNPAGDAHTSLVEIHTNYEDVKWSIWFLGCFFITKLRRR